MNVTKAAERTLDLVDTHKHWVTRSEAGNTIGHAAWMLHGIIDGYIQHDKAQRWLGYAQGLLVALDAATLDDMKQANFSASEGQK